MAAKTPAKKTPSKARKNEMAEAISALKSVTKQRGFSPQAFANGLTEVLFGFQPGRIGAQLSQVDTLEYNLRHYQISNIRLLLSEIYVEHGPIKSAIDVPVDDALRGGVNFSSKQLSSDECDALKTFFEQEDVLGVGPGQAMRWNRLFGGAGIIPILPQDAATPFDLKSIKQGSRCEFRAVDLWELFYDKQATESFNPSAQVNPLEDPSVDFYRYYGANIAKSRVMKLKGLEAPSLIRPRLRGWGLSVTETMIRSVNQYLKATDVAFEVLDEFKVDIFQLDGLNESLVAGPEGQANAQARVNLTNRSKSYMSAMVLDAKDKYEQKQLTFSGLADVMREIRMQVAADLRMPMTKLFGISASGFNSGEDDLENYNGMVESEVRMKMKHHIIKCALICCQILFGKAPSDLTVEFAPLRVMSAKEEEEVKTAKLDRLLKVMAIGGMSSKEFKDAINKEKLLAIQLDTTTEVLNPAGADADLQGAGKREVEEIEKEDDEDPANESDKIGTTREQQAAREDD